MAAGIDICEEADEQELANQLHKSTGPKAGRHAGVYKHGLVDGRNATSVAECLLSCCSYLMCNVVFYHRGK